MQRKQPQATAITQGRAGEVLTQGSGRGNKEEDSLRERVYRKKEQVWMTDKEEAVWGENQQKC